MSRDWEAIDEVARDTALRLRRRTGSIATVSADATQRTSPEEHAVPDVVVDALIETVWAFPGVRLSYGRLLPPKRLSFVACAGPQEAPEVTGGTLQLDHAPEFLEALRTSDGPFAIEDVRSDPRTKPISGTLSGLRMGAVLTLPVLSRRGHALGAVAMDSPKPRTWTADEGAALERLGPLVALALDHADKRDTLSRVESQLLEFERRIGGIRGVVSGVIHDAGSVLPEVLAMIEQAARADPAEVDPLVQSTRALGSYLHDLCSELSALDHGYSRRQQLLDVGEVVADLAPALRALAGPDVTLLTRPNTAPIMVRVRRTGIARAIVNILLHARTARPRGRSFAIETRQENDCARIVLHGDALGTDAGLARLDAESQRSEITPDAVGQGLWLAHTELLLHSATLSITTDGLGRARIAIDLPLAHGDP